MKADKFIEIVPSYNGSYLLIEKEDFMALSVNCVVDDFSKIEYTIYDPKLLINKKVIMKIKRYLNKKVKVIVITSLLRYLIYLFSNRNKAVVFANDRTPHALVTGILCKKTILMSHQSRLPPGFFKRTVFNFFAKNFKYIKVSNPFEKKELIKIGVNAKKIIYLPLAIDHKFFSRKRKGFDKLKKKYNIKKNDKVILYLGNIRRFKNPYNILRAIKEVIKKGEKIIFLIAGADLLRNEKGKTMVEFARELGILKHIRYIGAVSQEKATEFIHIADIGIINSFHEGQCIVTYEFASAGLPMCLSRMGSFTSVFKDSALFNDTKDYKTLAENMIKYINNRGLRKKHSSINREIVKERCDYDTVKERLRKLFVNLR